LVIGEARGVQMRSKPYQGGGSRDVLTFRIDQFDASGNRANSIPVEMTGSINGIVTEGDKVEITGGWAPGKTLRPKLIRNLTTSGTVQTSGAETVIKLVIVGVFLFLVLSFFYMVSHH
jgi:hypothetical protein